MFIHVAHAYTRIPVFKVMNRASVRPTSRKKPRKGELTRSEKRTNRRIARIRVRVEHSIAGVKRSRVAKDVLRNTKTDFSDLAFEIVCGLHNWRVRHRKRRLKL